MGIHFESLLSLCPLRWKDIMKVAAVLVVRAKKAKAETTRTDSPGRGIRYPVPLIIFREVERKYFISNKCMSVFRFLKSIHPIVTLFL